jgi:hypothetical protein
VVGIVDLNDVGQGNGVVILGKVSERDGGVDVAAAQGILGSGDGFGLGDGCLRRGHFGCESYRVRRGSWNQKRNIHTGLDEARAVRDNLVGRVEGNIGHCVSHLDAVLQTGGRAQHADRAKQEGSLTIFWFMYTCLAVWAL